MIQNIHATNRGNNYKKKIIGIVLKHEWENRERVIVIFKKVLLIIMYKEYVILYYNG
jgi:hypothetical protein